MICQECGCPFCSNDCTPSHRKAWAESTDTSFLWRIEPYEFGMLKDPNTGRWVQICLRMYEIDSKMPFFAIAARGEGGEYTWKASCPRGRKKLADKVILAAINYVNIRKKEKVSALK